ncbi:bifunctional purine biosynthesis protein PurH [Thermoclostridium stercorarium subsp. stercorarium DSM 8532]|uniref:Bifunctional purine biosynthesis protein PurH n=1 Tax=Thermoclostridium stercorarium (strain ATCC 35414 / DSM 8532 / NCIMB 11754) TaxID=1121335 RepID=L7VU32_THES1|nr:bifunctional phosphoribosylaminoimidazolecarboxamide formyltransferase/IMP cyclohydrolase [Thermoclostridium stercorarium]AGC69093.1 bifunctional purine biosynthesis protein PurH [Thermoclostridium stercorarium subsp. stercorarium DSM 8532]AGI40065.1 phosphoribosylaminoimidazolecarboxamide formyltransferase [Thermoclostridium stercorarium subsp. stercorarium DSM 8532]
MIKRALISVSDKRGIVDFAKELETLGIGIISTGGTAELLQKNGIKVTGISEITGFPECLDGRVKTLHPKVHAGLLAMRDNPEHMKELSELGIEPIDMVVVNLYPFKQTILKEGVTLEEAIENIDIGGPTMLRAAAKNYRDVVVIVDPRDYGPVLEEIRKTGDVSAKTRLYLCYKVFEHTSHYDALIQQYMRSQLDEEFFPETLTLTFEKVQDMRYGENPHQKAVFYREVGNISGWLTQAEQLHGKELSFNNINDANGALELLKEFDEPAVVAVKHANPCGVGTGSDIYEAFMNAYEADKVSIFGGIVAANREIDSKTAEEMSKIFLEIVVAPSFSPEALEILKKKKNLRILSLPAIAEKSVKGYDMKKVGGGLLLQEKDDIVYDESDIKVVTKRKPTEEELRTMKFAMKVVKHVKSNAIVLAIPNRTIGIGCGQMNRITAARIAIEAGGDLCKGAVMASDAFFPFPDCVEAAYKAGVTAIIQPGGSIRDQESIDACDKYGIAMVFTGVRHFKH